MSDSHDEIGREPQRFAVLLGSFEPVVDLGLTAILSRDPQLIVRTCDIGGSISGAISRWAPQAAIVDEIAERHIRDLRRSVIPVPGLLVFAHQPTELYGLSLLAAGVSCVARTAAPGHILSAVRRVAQGDRLLLLDDETAIERRYPPGMPQLTPRELEVLRGLSEGKPHKQIAYEMKIGIRTVHTHTSRICQKLGARSKRDLIGLPVPLYGGGSR